jgi:vacuolar-type H+-ATPase subunit H
MTTPKVLESNTTTMPPEAARPLRQLKDVEASWEARLAQARAQAEETRRRCREELEEKVRQAREQADRAHSQRVEEARRQAGEEARRLLETAQFEAAHLPPMDESTVQGRLSEIRQVLFAGLEDEGPGGTPRSRRR